MAEADSMVLEMLKTMRQESKAQFQAVVRDMGAIHQRLDSLTAAFNDLASTHATHGEITAISTELDRLRQLVMEQDARIRFLETE
jgi:hypothetical protein